LLTIDLVRARRSDGRLSAAYLHGEGALRVLPLVEAYLATYARMVGKPRDEVEAALSAHGGEARDRLAVLGLRKVVDDTCEYASISALDPAELRYDVFLAAARAHRELALREAFDREVVLSACASRIGVSAAEVDAGLYADLRGREILRSPPSLTSEQVIDRYNLGLAQAILLRATRVEVDLDREEPARCRRVFRAARFHQLIHVVRRRADGAHFVELSGPYDLFGAAQRYGFRLALFLHSVLRCRSFRLRATVLWGHEKKPHVFEITPEDGLAPTADEPVGGAGELASFISAFRRLESEWSVRVNHRIFALPGEVVCIPDLVFTSDASGEHVYLEVFGFWSRAAVWQRVELLRKGFECRILLAVGKQLRVSEEALTEDDTGEIYVYRATISPRAILDRLRRPGRAAQNGLPS
jgi:predicted nuclease of restriction endonuclease-like RecB superfamily